MHHFFSVYSMRRASSLSTLSGPNRVREQYPADCCTYPRWRTRVAFSLCVLCCVLCTVIVAFLTPHRACLSRTGNSTVKNHPEMCEQTWSCPLLTWLSQRLLYNVLYQTLNNRNPLSVEKTWFVMIFLFQECDQRESHQMVSLKRATSTERVSMIYAQKSAHS